MDVGFFFALRPIVNSAQIQQDLTIILLFKIIYEFFCSIPTKNEVNKNGVCVCVFVCITHLAQVNKTQNQTESDEFLEVRHFLSSISNI